MAFCTKCGTQFEAGTAFCGNCGAAVAAAATIQLTFSKDAPQAGSANNVAAAEMKFVGRNYDYFNRKWKIAEQKKSKQSWNWAAFFLSPAWLAYRKMYLYCWIYIGILAAASLSEYAFGLSGTLSDVLDFAIALTLGMQGNALYKFHVQKKVKEITTMNTPERADIELARKGGTSIGAAIGFAILALAIFILIGLAAEKGPFAS